MVSLWYILRCVIISDGSLYCGPWLVCNGADVLLFILFYFIEIIFEFSIEYRVYDSGSKLSLGAWSQINSISLRGMSVMCTKFGQQSFPHFTATSIFLPIEAHFTPSSYCGFVSNYNNRKMVFYCILWY